MVDASDDGTVRPVSVSPGHRPRPVPLSVDIHLDSRIRRAVDIVVAATGLLVLSPVLLVLGLAVRLDTPGPAVFRQVRVGRDGRSFHILKFRTMVQDAATMGSQVSGRRDPRVTRMGRMLRATKLDELPQLVNVLLGEMTLIGPRAEVPMYVEHYTMEERTLLAARPGLTGAGQLLFTREQSGELDDTEDPEQHYLEHQLHPKLALDLEYLSDRHLATDCRLLLATVRCLFGIGRQRRRTAGDFASRQVAATRGRRTPTTGDRRPE